MKNSLLGSLLFICMSIVTILLLLVIYGPATREVPETADAKETYTSVTVYDKLGNVLLVCDDAKDLVYKDHGVTFTSSNTTVDVTDTEFIVSENSIHNLITIKEGILTEETK